MRALFLLLAACLVPSSAFALAACPPGWAYDNWVDPKMNSPKYVVGRIIAEYPHTPNGLKAAMPKIEIAYPGSVHIDDKTDDKVDIPCVGVIDLVVAADGPDVGTGWAWQVVEDKCGQCTPHLCSPPSATGGGGTGAADARGPGLSLDGGQIVTGARAVMPDAFNKLKDAETCGDGAWLDKVVEGLQGRDSRYGNSCSNADCSQAHRDLIAFHMGDDEPYQGAQGAALFRVVKGICTSGAAPAWERAGTGRWTNRGRHLTQGSPSAARTSGNCTWSPSRPCVDGMRIDARTPNGNCAGRNPGQGFQRRDGDWIRVLGPCSAFPGD